MVAVDDEEGVKEDVSTDLSEDASDTEDKVRCLELEHPVVVVLDGLYSSEIGAKEDGVPDPLLVAVLVACLANNDRCRLPPPLLL